MTRRKGTLAVFLAGGILTVLGVMYCVAARAIMRNKPIPVDYPLCKLEGRSASIEMRALPGMHPLLELSVESPSSSLEMPPQVTMTVALYEGNQLIGTVSAVPDPRIKNSARHGSRDVWVFSLEETLDLLAKMSPGKRYRLQVTTDEAVPQGTWLWLGIFQTGPQGDAGAPVDHPNG